MIILRIAVCVFGSMLAVPILCGALGKSQSYFEQTGRENSAIAIGITAGAIGFGASQIFRD